MQFRNFMATTIALVCISSARTLSEVPDGVASMSDKTLRSKLRWTVLRVACAPSPIAEDGILSNTEHAHVDIDLLVMNLSHEKQLLNFELVRLIDDEETRHRSENSSTNGLRIILDPMTSRRTTLKFRTPLLLHRSKLELPPEIEGHRGIALLLGRTDCFSNNISENRF